MLRLLSFGPKRLAPELRVKLPPVNAWIDMVITGGGPRGTVCVEALGARDLTVTALPGIAPGVTGVFSYANEIGRFRFSAKCLSLAANVAVFGIPERVETLQVFSGAQKRVAARLEANLPAQWRYAPMARGHGDYARGSLTDLSRSGASLIVDREVKSGTYVETRFAISTSASPLVIVAEVMRTSAIESSKKTSLGLRFHGLRAEEERAIMEFINKRQADRRSRGLG